MSEPYRKKLIEVALPLEAINRESAREKSIRHGHPSTLHLWWARRPLAACRAVLFASIVDDPSSRPDLFPTEKEQEAERQRLFRIIEELVKWENSNNETVLEAARAEIMKATDGSPPPVLDPFCGGGSIPLEAQRLGLEAHASDLNPVAVLITKALIEIPPKFAGKPPVNTEAREKLAHDAAWKGVQGLAEDVRYYGKWMRDEAFKRIGHLYPKTKLPDGAEATVIAWLWARTVMCPNPACGVRMPLVRSFALSTKQGKEWYAQPIVEGRSVRFQVRQGKDDLGGTVSRRGARCVSCGSAVPFNHVRAEGQAGRMGVQLMSIVAEGERARVYLSPDEAHCTVANSAQSSWAPDATLPHNPRDFKTPNYGLRTFADLFTQRQLVALTAFSDLVGEAHERVLADSGDELYAGAVTTLLGISAGKLAAFHNTLARWRPGEGKSAPAFGRQALPMVWDYAEVNVFAGAGGDWLGVVGGTAAVLGGLPEVAQGISRQLDATQAVDGVARMLVCTDPPYYDNVGYADLSDFFYVWLRRSLAASYPDLFSTLLTPKTQELVATPYRFGGDRLRADIFFEEGLGAAFQRIHEASHSDYPVTVFYAFKQSEEDGDGAGVASTGWETMLKGLLEARFAVTGTWPMRTEMKTRQAAMATNALASSIVLVCRPRAVDAGLTTRRDFVAALKAELPVSLHNLQHGNIAPVDLAQAAIGPGMAVFSRYTKVVEADGSAMTVRTALGLINQALDEILAEQEGDFDPDTRFAVIWFEQHGMNEGAFGEAEVLTKAKDTAVSGLVEACILEAKRGKVRLLSRPELDMSWDPDS